MACPTLAEVKSCASFHPLLPGVAGWVEKLITADLDPIATVFSGPEEDIAQSPPVDRFLYRLCRYGNCSAEVFVQMVVYVLRYLQVTEQPLTKQSVHRLLIAAFVVAVKHRDDQTYTNTYYAKVGGVSLQEFNVLERAFILTLDFDFEVSYGAYAATMRCLECSMTDPAEAEEEMTPPRARSMSVSTSQSAGESSVGYDDNSVDTEGSPCYVRQASPVPKTKRQSRVAA
eukprot:TRINITY_DN719_c0_g1_i2.p2 TRINITY_DN719_c0_g1~~TRINITY_DN719_c0_g1_i2.p2  ORF type:complete len:229 (+),score=82.25 TRINITY_DN719_c0_g1_i2:63-749(+)